MLMTDLVRLVSEKTGSTQVSARESIDAVFETITDVMREGEDITIPGFGTFSGKMQAERTCRNPRTGEPIVVPEHIAPAFKANKRLKDLCK